MKNKEETFGSMGHLTEAQAFWEDLVYLCKELPVIEAMNALQKAFEAKYYSDRYQETPGQDK